MHLVVSNLAWHPEQEAEALDLLRNSGISGIEVAPRKIFGDLLGVMRQEAEQYRESLQKRGFTIPALQAYLFGRSELKLFREGSRTDFVLYTKRALSLTAWLGANILVFGAPKNRRYEGIPPKDAMEIARVVFCELGVLAYELGVFLCIEPNPAEYGCEFLTNVAQAAAFVRDVAHPGVALQLDVGCMRLAGDDIRMAIEENVDILRHVHVSKPFLSLFDSADAGDRVAAEALQRVGYRGWISLEMLPGTKPLDDLQRSLVVFQNAYSLYRVVNL